MHFADAMEMDKRSFAILYPSLAVNPILLMTFSSALLRAHLHELHRTNGPEEVVVRGVYPLGGPGGGPREHVAGVGVVVHGVPPGPHPPHVGPQQVLVRPLARGGAGLQPLVAPNPPPAVRPPGAPLLGVQAGATAPQVP